MPCPSPDPVPDVPGAAAPRPPLVPRRAVARVVLRDGLAGRGIRLEALFAQWPAGAREEALAEVHRTFGVRSGGAVFVERDGQYVEFVDLASAARLRLLVPVGL